MIFSGVAHFAGLGRRHVDSVPGEVVDPADIAQGPIEGRDHPCFVVVVGIDFGSNPDCLEVDGTCLPFVQTTGVRERRYPHENQEYGQYQHGGEIAQSEPSKSVLYHHAIAPFKNVQASEPDVICGDLPDFPASAITVSPSEASLLADTFDLPDAKPSWYGMSVAESIENGLGDRDTGIVRTLTG